MSLESIIYEVCDMGLFGFGKKNKEEDDKVDLSRREFLAKGAKIGLASMAINSVPFLAQEARADSGMPPGISEAKFYNSLIVNIWNYIDGDSDPEKAFDQLNYGFEPLRAISSADLKDPKKFEEWNNKLYIIEKLFIYEPATHYLVEMLIYSHKRYGGRRYRRKEFFTKRKMIQEKEYAPKRNPSMVHFARGLEEYFDVFIHRKGGDVNVAKEELYKAYVVACSRPKSEWRTLMQTVENREYNDYLKALERELNRLGGIIKGKSSNEITNNEKLRDTYSKLAVAAWSATYLFFLYFKIEKPNIDKKNQDLKNMLKNPSSYKSEYIVTFLNFYPEYLASKNTFGYYIRGSGSSTNLLF